MKIEIRGFEFELLPEKAIRWKVKNTLLITDLHLGKIMHFRKAGIALPQQVFEYNFIKLDHLIKAHHPERIIFLGDLFHHQLNTEWKYFERWRKQFLGLEMIVVLGNHDILPPVLFHEINIKVVDELEENGFCFRHHPGKEQENRSLFTFCGHIHPVFRIQSPTSYTLRLPCFVQENHQMILPSFGLFTGGHTIHKTGGKRIFIIAESQVFEVT